MPTIRQTTVDGRTFKLKQYRTDRHGKQYEYHVTKDGRRVGGGVYTRDEGEKMFRELALGERQNNQMEPTGSTSSGGPLPGADADSRSTSEPSIPGMGTLDTDGDDNTDDDDQPSLPFF